MATRERRPVLPAPLEPGVVVATCTGASAEVSKAGNPMVLWLFDTPHGSVRRYTLRQGAGSASLYETTVALGLPRAFRLSEAAGRKCRLDLARDGPYWQIERAMAL